MLLRAPAIVLASRPHAEAGVIASLLTAEAGQVAAYVAGGRGRHLRPVLIPGNLVDLQLAARLASQLPFARLELVASRGPWLAEPLPAAAMAWACALTASALPERQPYPGLFDALDALLRAICHAPSARGWVGALAAYELLMLRELGYGGGEVRPEGPLEDILATLDALARLLGHYLLADARSDVMAARHRLTDLLEQIPT